MIGGGLAVMAARRPLRPAVTPAHCGGRSHEGGGPWTRSFGISYEDVEDVLRRQGDPSQMPEC